MPINEADTCRTYVVPKLYSAGWEDTQISEQKSFTDGRIMLVGNRAANTFLAESYLEGHNTKYAVAPRETADFHQAPAAGLDLKQVFCLEEERKVSNDWVVQYGKRWLQIEAENPRGLVGAGSTVAVREHRDGGLTLLRGSTALRWHDLTQRPKAKEPITKRRVVMPPKPPQLVAHRDMLWREQNIVVGDPLCKIRKPK